jgi:hypothetical protein
MSVDKPMYRVHHYNFGMEYFFETYHAAKAFTHRAGFEAALWHGEHRLASFNPISGWKLH